MRRDRQDKINISPKQTDEDAKVSTWMLFARERKFKRVMIIIIIWIDKYPKQGWIDFTTAPNDSNYELEGQKW